MPNEVKTKKVGEFEFDMGLPIAEATRNARKSETAQRLKAMPIGASFLEPVEVPEAIKGEEERAKAFTEQARATSNRLSGAIRRFKEKNEGYEFVLRTVNSEEQGTGVRVYRTKADGKTA